MHRSTCFASRKNGFTIIELLVVIATISLLLSLTAPAIQGARERARWLTCTANLRDIGVALHGYESTHGTLPRGGFMALRRANPSNPSQGSYLRSHSPHMYLLPFLDQSSLYDQIDIDTPTDRNMVFPVGSHDPNAEVRATRLPKFLCPSDSSADIARNSYRANLGLTAFTYGKIVGKISDHRLGPFAFADSVPRLRDCTDGLSNTAAFSERLVGDQDPRQYHAGRDVFDVSEVTDPNDIMLSPSPSDACVRACGSLTNSQPRHDSTSGLYWLHGGLMDSWYTHLLTPNHEVPDCGSISGILGFGMVTARSEHPGGVNTLLLDGSARLVSSRISATVWSAVGASRDGESVSW